MKLDDKDVATIRALTDAQLSASLALTAATHAREEAEMREKQCSLEARTTIARLRTAMREAALRSGVDPEKVVGIKDGELVTA